MNKRNTVIISAVLGLLVLALIGRNVFFIFHHTKTCKVEIKEEVAFKKEMSPSVFMDSIAIKNCSYPIVIHYQNPQFFGNVYAKNHIIGLSMLALDSCPPMPDSTEAIHVYIFMHKNIAKYLNLGVYNKATLSEDVEYRLTYPVKDNVGFRVVKDTGFVCSEVRWKEDGVLSADKFRKKAEEKMTRQVEESLVQDIIKKMHKNEDSD